MKVVLGGIVWLALGPAVAVEVEPPLQAGAGVDPALRPWLVQRLLEDPDAQIASRPADADAVVRLRGRSDGAVEVRGTRAFVVDPGPPAVMNLEVLHRARSLIEMVPGDGEPPPGPFVTVRTQGTAPEGAEGLVHAKLLGAGFTLRGKSGPDTATVCVWFDEAGNAQPPERATFRVTVAAPQARCGDTTITMDVATLRRPGGADPLAAWVHRSLGADLPVVQATEDERPPRPEPEGEADWVNADVGVARTFGPPMSGNVPWRDSAPEVRLLADGGLRMRPDARGSFFSRVRAGRTEGPGGTVLVQTSAYRRNGDRGTDTILAAGPDWQFRFRKRLGVELAAVAGAEIHTFERLLRRGGVAGFYASAPVAFSVGLTEQARVHLSVEPAYSQPIVEQRLEDDVNLTRTAWSVRAGLGLSYGWRIR